MKPALSAVQALRWDAVWDVQVSTDAKGWKAEFRIPFSQLRFNPKGPEAGNPIVSRIDPGSAFGADVKHAVTPGLNLTATINPDFGQVEADPAVVNLSAFETFFAERRPFFVEGSGTYQCNLDCNDGECTGLFYSRRIGRAPQGNASAPDGGFASWPGQSTIVGAAKLTGRVGSFSVGALNAVTSEEQARIATGDARSTQVVEPLTSYSVGRARREFANQSTVGFMFTATNRRLRDEVLFLPEQAYTGGVDWDWRLRQSTYSLSGYWAGSSVAGSREAITRLQQSNVHSYQRPDASHVDLDPDRTVLNGQAGFASIGKISGERLRFNSNVGFKTPGFEVNDLGYLRRADQITSSHWVQLRHDKPSRHLRTFRINFNQWSGWNFDGDRLYLGANINAHAVFTSNWSTGMGVNLNTPEFADRVTRGGPGVRTNASYNVWHYLNSDNRKPVSCELFDVYATDRHGSWVFEATPAVTVRRSSALSISGGVGFTRNVDGYQWVAKVTDNRDHYVFGSLDQTTLSITARVNYTVTPTLSIQVYAQPFVSAGDYRSYDELVDGRARRDEDRYAPYAYTGNADFNYRSFRTTNVLRWEFRPGSALFVVWQQGRQKAQDRGDFRFARDFGGVFGAPSQNVFLVKLTYWLNP